MFRYVVACWLAGGVCMAQSSASHRVEGGALNAGGRPQGGAVAQSVGHRLTLDTLGGIVRAESVSASWRVGSAFPLRYRPPGEALSLRFIDDDTLAWLPERSAGRYNLYRDLLTQLGPASFGLCLQLSLPSPTAEDPALPPSGAGYFYLVTAKNRLGEEGTLGSGSTGSRGNTNACP